MKQIRSVFSILLALTLILSLCACGGQQPDVPVKNPAPVQPTNSTPAQPAPDPTGTDLSNTLVYAGENESSINPVVSAHDEIVELVFSGLMKYDGNGHPIEDLAGSYTFDKESLTYTFKLRSGVKWHDGKDFTADDVVFTYEVLTRDETLSSSMKSDYENIVAVEAVDPQTVTITLDDYRANMLGYFTIGIIPRHLLEGEDMNTTSFNQHPVGTGRFRFVEWDMTGGMITFLRNEDYYGKVPNIERLIYKTVAVESTKATMLESGEADLAWLNANYAESFRGKPGYKNWDFTTADYRGASMEMASDFWSRNSDSIGVLNYALDKEAIVKSVLNGQGCTAYSPIQLNPLGTDPAADIYSYDLDKFAQEMEKLGWQKGEDGIYVRNGERFHFTIQTRDYEEERVDIANVMSAMLKQAGVEMEVVLVTKFDWDAGYDGFLAGFATQFDPDMAYKQFVTGGSDNTRHYSNETVDQLLKSARHESDPAKRLKLYSEFERVYAQSPNVLLVAYLDGNYVGSSAVDGLNTSRVLGHHAVGVMWNIEEWTLNR